VSHGAEQAELGKSRSRVTTYKIRRQLLAPKPVERIESFFPFDFFSENKKKDSIFFFFLYFRTSKAFLITMLLLNGVISAALSDLYCSQNVVKKFRKCNDPFILFL